MALAFWFLSARQWRVFLRVFSGISRLVGCIWRGIVLGLALGIDSQRLAPQYDWRGFDSMLGETADEIRSCSVE